MDVTDLNVFTSVCLSSSLCGARGFFSRGRVPQYLRDLSPEHLLQSRTIQHIIVRPISDDTLVLFATDLYNLICSKGRTLIDAKSLLRFHYLVERGLSWTELDKGSEKATLEFIASGKATRKIFDLEIELGVLNHTKHDYGYFIDPEDHRGSKLNVCRHSSFFSLDLKSSAPLMVRDYNPLLVTYTPPLASEMEHFAVCIKSEEVLPFATRKFCHMLRASLFRYSRFCRRIRSGHWCKSLADHSSLGTKLIHLSSSSPFLLRILRMMRVIFLLQGVPASVHNFLFRRHGSLPFLSDSYNHSTSFSDNKIMSRLNEIESSFKEAVSNLDVLSPFCGVEDLCMNKVSLNDYLSNRVNTVAGVVKQCKVKYSEDAK
jgi:hypothetical protein